MNGLYKRKVIEQKEKNLIALEELKVEKHYNHYDIEMYHGVAIFTGVICLLAGFIIGYLIK